MDLVFFNILHDDVLLMHTTLCWKINAELVYKVGGCILSNQFNTFNFIYVGILFYFIFNNNKYPPVYKKICMAYSDY